MANELKTIRDLGFYENKEYPSECHMCNFSMTKLKDEAKKWIKTLESMEYMDLDGKQYEPNSMEFHMLRKFFNLDEVNDNTFRGLGEVKG